MVSRRWFSIVAVICALSFMSAGCKHRSPDGGDSLDPNMIGGGEGTEALGERTDLGTKIEGLNFSNVLFDYDSFQVSEGEFAKIDEVANYMKSNDSVLLVTEGNCDERGSREYNMSLGEHRALAVRAHLVSLGIKGTRIQTKSYGEEYPANAGHDESAWAQNRRVEFALYKP